MLKNMTYQKKFELLNPWLLTIIEAVKKDLRNDHLQNDRIFHKSFFGNKPASRLTVEEMSSAYDAAIKNGAENIAEFIATRWLLKNTDLYHFFERELVKIDPNFDQLDVIDEAKGQELLNLAVSEFNPISVYLFTVFNSVVFNDNQIKRLRELALSKVESDKTLAANDAEKKSFDELKKRYDIDIQRLTDKYEKKLSGFEKKYLQDTETLKKQISGLQRKLQESSAS